MHVYTHMYVGIYEDSHVTIEMHVGPVESIPKPLRTGSLAWSASAAPGV